MDGGAQDGTSRSEVTVLLGKWTAGEADAIEKLTPIVYGELRKLARSYLGRERSAQTLQPTELVHEAFLRLVDQRPDGQFENRKHFYGIASRLMRQILADHFRRKQSLKRGSGAAPLPYDDRIAIGGQDSGIVALDDAMTALSKFDERKCRVIELRFFGGFSPEEIAEALGISVSTVGREQRLAEAWLGKEMLKG